MGPFDSRCSCFFFGGSATPIASKPVQRTDLVDASESRWGGKKNRRVFTIESVRGGVRLRGMSVAVRGVWEEWPYAGWWQVELELQGSERS